MIRILILFISIFIVSCTDNGNAIKTLNIVIEDKILLNLQTINRMEMSVQDMGNRKDDLKVLSNSKDFLKSRSQFGLPNTTKQFDHKFKISKALEFIDSLNTLTKLNYKIDQQLVTNIEDLSKNRRISKPIRNRLIYLDILKLESTHLKEKLKKVGAGCGFFDCFTFDLNTTNDTVKVGYEFESILTVAERWLSKEILTFDSISVSFEGSPIKFQHKNIGKAHHLKFKVNNKGVYKYSGIAVAEYEELDELDYQIECEFEFQIIGN